MTEQADYTQRQLGPDGLSKWAVFLPACSGALAFIVGRNMTKPLDPARLPVGLPNVEMINWMNLQEAAFPYRWTLYSGGHAALDLTKESLSEDMMRKRDRQSSFLVGDSGGFQIGKGQWPGDWKAGSGCPAAQAKRDGVLKWLDGMADYSMVLDVPAWVIKDPRTAAATQITTHEQAVAATRYNNDYFMDNRKGIKNGGTKFLNVLQGNTHEAADEWYDTMKDYCDPERYENHFDGWAMGGQNMCDMHLILSRFVALKFEGLLQEGVHDWVHFLGLSKLEWAVMFSDIQRALREYVNPKVTLSFDCASPFLTTANGQIYSGFTLEHDKRWKYSTDKAVDDRLLFQETAPYGDFMRERINPRFTDSVISSKLMAKDVCHRGPGVLNKSGKLAKTSWDSYSYALLMAHNTATHIDAVQSANELYDSGNAWPNQLWNVSGDHAKFRNIVMDIFSQPTREKAEAIINHYDSYWMDIIGGRGFTGKSAKNSLTMFNKLFEV